MRRIALYSDVHGNTVAYSAVLDDIKAEGVTERYCLGDLVGLGPRPNEAVALARSMDEVVIQGNYDRAVGAHLTTPGSEFPTPQEELDGAESYGFTVAEITRESADYLHGLPPDRRIEETGVNILLCHGTPRLVAGLVPPDAPPAHLVELAREVEADIVCCGHSHIPFHRSLPTESGVVHWVNVGSVGRPRDGDPRAAWVELVVGEHAEVVERAPTDTACRRVGDSDAWLGVVVHRVAYDIDAVVRDMTARGLPSTLAAGLRVGLEEHNTVPFGAPKRPESDIHTEVVEFAPEVGARLACGHTREECTCQFDDRTAAYEALARLYRGDITEVAAAVRRLRIAMRTCRIHRHVDEAAILAAFEASDLSLRTVGGRAAFTAERERLYGLDGSFDPFVNVLSAEETTYLSGDTREHLASIEAAYRDAAFTVPEIGDGVVVPAHISTELSFMAHCLRAVGAGDPKALGRARDFFVNHLAEWAVLFAVVIGQQAREPVMCYAGLALDKFLTCEGSLFRHTVPEHGEVRVRQQ